jgi:predicted metal-dependent HD superfamily phosphohydrolase
MFTRWLTRVNCVDAFKTRWIISSLRLYKFSKPLCFASRTSFKGVRLPSISGSQVRNLCKQQKMDGNSFIYGVWLNLCESLSSKLDFHTKSVIYKVIEARYSEDHRSYHTLEHVEELLKLSSIYELQLRDPVAVNLSILFHDVVYDPRSKTNEEDSAELFLNLLGPFLHEDLLEKVYNYIIATKSHAVLNSADKDLQFFIDMDMSIVGVDPERYVAYARKIRKEYQFVPEHDYIVGRAAVLESFIGDTKDNGSGSCSGEPSAHIFATPEFRDKYEAQARRNIALECDTLKSGKLM